MYHSDFDFPAAKRAGQIIDALDDHGTEELHRVAVNGNQIASEELLALLLAACHSHELTGDELREFDLDDDFVELGLCAAEILAHRNETEAIDSIVRFFGWAEECDGEDAVGGSGPDIIACFRGETAETFLRHALDTQHGEWLGSVLADGVKLLGNKHPDARESLRPLIIKGLTDAPNHRPFVNAQLMMMAVDWQMTEAAEPIERAFAASRIDCGFAGDWEVIREKLQVEGLGLPTPKHPVYSGTEFRESTFVTAPLFDEIGESDDDAVADYLANACKAFATSDEWEQLVGIYHETYPYDVDRFLRFGMDYLGKPVDDMTPGSAEEILLELYPSKVSMDAADSDRVIDVLTAFWTFCDREHGVKRAAEIAKKIERLRGHFHDALENPANFGIAKSFVMAGVEAGYDMTTQEGMTQFMQVYNQRLAGSPLGSSRRSDSPQAMKPPPALTRKDRKKELAKIMKRKKK